MQIQIVKSCIFNFLLFFVIEVSAQKASISSITQIDNDIQITIYASLPFYIGNNAYYLHIGENDFTRCKQINGEDKSEIIFFIPKQEFDLLQPGAYTWLSYGNDLKQVNSSNMIEQYCISHPQKGWLLGEFNKNLLSK